MLIKTSDLIGPALDWAVAVCEGETESVQFSSLASSKHYYAPSRKWAQGGPIIETNEIDLFWDGGDLWDGSIDRGRFVESGPTPLVAAMRCYVASKLGDEVEVPDELA